MSSCEILLTCFSQGSRHCVYYLGGFLTPGIFCLHCAFFCKHKVFPRLAEQYPVSPGPSVWIFYLHSMAWFRMRYNDATSMPSITLIFPYSQCFCEIAVNMIIQGNATLAASNAGDCGIVIIFSWVGKAILAGDDCFSTTITQ